MIKADQYYLDNLIKISNEGTFDENPRPKYVDGTPAHSKFITQVWEEYDISNGEFPITTLRNTAIKTGIKEILWIYQQQTPSLKVARDMGIHWWNDWDIGDGTIGMRYGATVSAYNLMDKLLFNLKNDPFSRRHIMNLYQYTDMEATEGLHPCAFETLWSVRKVHGEMYLDLTLTQRSNDYIMAGYINKIQYVALQMMVAAHVGYKVGKFCHLVQNLHIYDRHFNAVDELLSRTNLEKQPMIHLSKSKNFYEYTANDFTITDVDGIKKLNNSLELAI